MDALTKKRIHIFQPQYDSVLSDKSVQPWLPYSAACLWAYAQSFDDISEYWQLDRLHYQRLPINDVLDSLIDPALCAFSCYVWNEKYNLALAQAIKQRWPDCVIVFGGPQTGGNHIKHEFIDCMIMSEGETAFVEVLRSVRDGKPLEQIIRRTRLEDLDIPSPYLLGLFDDIIARAPKDVCFQTVIETNRGCPYACTYCDWGGLTYSKIKKFSMHRVEEELKWIARNPISVVMLADANFGIFKERDMEIARLIRKHFTGSKIDYLNITFTKNSNRTVFEIAKEIGPIVKSVTLSMQSMSQDTLKAIKRDNMKSNDLAEMLALSHEYDIPTYTDMILGMPEETLQSWKEGMMTLIELGQDGFIDTNFTNVLENTELNKIQRQLYNIKTIIVERYQNSEVDDATGIEEGTELVVSTNTMSLDDMVAGWMWHWLVQFFHASGYSHIMSHYLHHVHGVRYIDFYNTLLDHCRQDTGAIGDEYRRIEHAAHSLLTTGSFGSDIKNVYDFYIASFTVFYANLSDVFDMVERAAKSLANIDSTVMTVQRHAVFNPVWKTGTQIQCNFDIKQWTPGEFTYQVVPRLKHFDGSYESFRRRRRGTFWKNRFDIIDV